jgi:hypothetical protein
LRGAAVSEGDPKTIATERKIGPYPPGSGFLSEEEYNLSDPGEEVGRTVPFFPAQRR